MKKYYAITTSMTFQKTVLVPADAVENISEAIDLVDAGIEIASIDLLEAECKTEVSQFANENGIRELSDEDANCYEIIGKE